MIYFFQDSLINNKKKNIYNLFKKQVFCVTIYNAIQKFGVSTFFFLFLKKLIIIFRDVLN